MKNELQTKPDLPVVNKEITPMDMLQIAVEKGADMDKLEKLMDLQERWENNKAQKEFIVDMTGAQSKMKRIGADMENKQTRSRYASYAALDKALRPIYTDSGFSISFDTGDGAPADYVRVLAYVSHNKGFSRTYKIDMPADGKGAKGGDVMTKTHAGGAAITYGMRYLLKMIFNVAIGEDDDDGNGIGGTQTITAKQKQELMDLIEKNEVDLIDFLKYGEVESLDAIKSEHFEGAKAILVKRGAK